MVPAAQIYNVGESSQGIQVVRKLTCLNHFNGHCRKNDSFKKYNIINTPNIISLSVHNSNGYQYIIIATIILS